MTETPTYAPKIPVTIGKSDPPICAKTNTKEMAVALMSCGNILVPTEIACGLEMGEVSFPTANRVISVGLTVANNGPVKKPTKLMATDAATTLGTLCVWSVMPSRDRISFKRELE